MTCPVIVTRPISQVNQQGDDEAAQCGLQQTPTAVKTEPNHRGDIRQVTYTEPAQRREMNGLFALIRLPNLTAAATS